MKKVEKEQKITREMEYLAFPVSDILDILMQSFSSLTAKAARMVEKDPTLTIEDVANPVWIDYSLSLPLPISQELLDEIEKIEERMLQHGGSKDCDQCRESRTSVAGTKCHGIYKKGDLLKSMMAGILRVGFQGFLDTTLQAALAKLLGSNDLLKETTAAETFNPELRKVLH